VVELRKRILAFSLPTLKHPHIPVYGRGIVKALSILAISGIVLTFA
jgi:hypothetical protein